MSNETITFESSYSTTTYSVVATTGLSVFVSKNGRKPRRMSKRAWAKLVAESVENNAHQANLNKPARV